MTRANPDLTDRTVIIMRRFDAPARLLFLAYSRPEHIRRWFGPVGWPVTMAEMDFRVGGQFRFQMTGPEGQTNTPFGGTYLEIIQDREIKYDNGFEAKGAERMVVTVTFDEADGQTLLTIETVFGSVKMRNLHVVGGYVEGTQSCLDQLETLVAEMAG